MKVSIFRVAMIEFLGGRVFAPVSEYDILFDYVKDSGVPPDELADSAAGVMSVAIRAFQNNTQDVAAFESKNTPKVCLLVTYLDVTDEELVASYHMNRSIRLN